ncbi:RNA polymerase II-binding domain-containing protein [Podospora fimiseda]|uniref:RNA polymerase II-binding domain-containing protein n=1 Tax=Podospora fimiseda TaxID=252190 RepID=A0AAN7BMC9_9PEZI|nr:RNA polymerase II-binding domain-containing protein [Podospora fimiseda]
MAYTDDAVLSKLSALNETHDSIATTAQWIMFHRRHAAQTIRLWLTKLKDMPSPKRLNMIYVANEVTQQSKARHKDDFTNAFAPFIADATYIAYKGASPEIQSKVRRVVDVWRDRNIFDKETIQGIYTKLAEVDKMRPAAAGGAFGAGFRSSSPAIPPELSPLITQQEAISKSLIPMKSALTTADNEYEKLIDPAAQHPALPLQAARLNGLLKILASAEGAVAESMRTRKEMIQSLQKLLVANQQALEEEEGHMKKLSGRRTEIEKKKNDIETTILGQGTNYQEQQPSGDRTSTEPERPEVEALTPPHKSDADDSSYQGFSGQNGGGQSVAFHTHHSAPGQQTAFSTSGIELLSNLASQYQSVPVNGSSNKKRKLNNDDSEFPDLAGDDGIDADVQEMLRKDTQGN